MLTGNKKIMLADIESNQDKATGDRIKSVVRAKVLAAVVELIGIQTAQVAQVQGFNPAYSITVKRVLYGNEKYLYFDGNLYEVKTISKAQSPKDMLLNVQISNDKAAEAAIEEWINSADI